MNKAQRLVQLIMIINEKKRFTIQELADEFSVSRRTMIRDLMELGEMGVPLYAEVGAAGGYRLLRERVLPPINFTENEAIAFFFASQSLQNYKSLPFEDEVSSALNKLYHYLSSDVKSKINLLKQKLLFWVPPHDIEVPHLRKLLEASLEQQVIHIVYDSEAHRRERRIQAIGIYTMNGLWYLQAYCFDRQAYRVFRVDRVLTLSIDEDQSQRMIVDKDSMDQWILHQDGVDQVDLEVKLTRKGVRRCQTDVWLAQVMTVNEDGSGWIRTRMDNSYVPWAVNFFLGLGTDAIVKQPLQVKDGIRGLLEQLIEQYQD
jgi:predicted DNA-binding transcriptional regulator YafY